MRMHQNKMELDWDRWFADDLYVLSS